MITGDLLSASSLVLASVALLYATWYDALNQARGTPKKRFRADREPAIEHLTSALRSRALPLLVASVLMAAVLAPPALATAWHAIAEGHGEPYNPTKAAFVIVWLLCCTVATSTASASCSLFVMLRDFKRND